MSEDGVWIDSGRLVLEPPSAEAVFLGLADDAPLFADYLDGAHPARGRPAGLREAASAASPAGSSVAASRNPAGRPRAGCAPSR